MENTDAVTGILRCDVALERLVQMGAFSGRNEKTGPDEPDRFSC
jgi:hypothetical protein